MSCIHTCCLYMLCMCIVHVYTVGCRNVNIQNVTSAKPECYDFQQLTVHTCNVLKIVPCMYAMSPYMYTRHVYIVYVACRYVMCTRVYYPSAHTAATL